MSVVGMQMEDERQMSPDCRVVISPYITHTYTDWIRTTHTKVARAHYAVRSKIVVFVDRHAAAVRVRAGADARHVQPVRDHAVPAPLPATLPPLQPVPAAAAAVSRPPPPPSSQTCSRGIILYQTFIIN